MAVLSLSGVSFGFGSDLLLDDVNLNIEEGDRACLIGRNGSGKSTLLRILHGDVHPDKGEIHKAAGICVSYLPQAVPESLPGTAGDVAVSWIKKTHGSAGVHGVHHAASRMLSQLKLDASCPYNDLSGGQKRRALLARAVSCEPDLLLLDEPTNHLDIHTISWLEEFLLRYCRTLLFVTHDRSFLRRVANRIIDLDRGRLAHWACDYETFLKRKAELLNDEEVNNARFDKKLSREEIWIRKGIRARRTRNEGRVRQLLLLREERSARRVTDGAVRLNVQQAGRSGAKVIEAGDVAFSFEGSEPVISRFTTTVMRGDRIGIIGANGSGKTTLLRLLIGELQPCSGRIEMGARLELAYFDQHRAVVDNSMSVAENAGGGRESVVIDGRPRHVISYLQDFLFTPERAKTPVAMLSGGERNRLLLAMLFAKPSNVLVMDEPTNDLDSETIELLEEQLMNYSGTLLMVSHDRQFLENAVTRIFAMRGDGLVEQFSGGYEEYARFGTEAGQQLEKASRKQQPAKGGRQEKRFGFKEKRELEAIPAKIEELEAEQSALHEAMSRPDYFRRRSEDLASDQKRAVELSSAIEELYGRWDMLEALRIAGG